MKKVLLIPDTHVPFEDKKAFDLMLTVGRDLKPDVIVILGDFLDAYSVSSHVKDPEKRGLLLRDEVKAARKRLDQLDALGAKQKLFVSGNHEDRLDRYISDKAPDLFGLVGVSALLQLKTRGWTYTPYRHHAELGKLVLVHDAGRAGLAATADAVSKFGANVVHGHTHSFVTVVRGDARGGKHVGMSVGWLGDPNAANYAHEIHKNLNWSHGFGVGYMRDNGWVHLCPVNILPDYSCVVEGKLFTSGKRSK